FMELLASGPSGFRGRPAGVGCPAHWAVASRKPRFLGQPWRRRPKLGLRDRPTTKRPLAGSTCKCVHGGGRGNSQAFGIAPTRVKATVLGRNEQWSDRGCDSIRILDPHKMASLRPPRTLHGARFSLLPHSFWVSSTDRIFPASAITGQATSASSLCVSALTSV